PDTEFLSLNAKLRDADTRVEALAWLRPTERLRLLGDRIAFDALVKLPASQAEALAEGDRRAS
ncbi:MAG TPA: hypothetical protein VIR38_13305, partial [Thalassobaculum sp.]